jgi:hypothetical protein
MPSPSTSRVHDRAPEKPALDIPSLAILIGGLGQMALIAWGLAALAH